jgi:hypothetical protein
MLECQPQLQAVILLRLPIPQQTLVLDLAEKYST